MKKIILFVCLIFLIGCSSGSFDDCFYRCQRVYVLDKGFCNTHGGDTYGQTYCKDGTSYGEICLDKCIGNKKTDKVLE